MCLNNHHAKRYQNCFICFFRPALLFGYTGITPINFHCDHSERPVKCFLKRSWLGTSISGVLCATISFFGIHSAYALCGAKISTREDVLLVGALMINFVAAYMMSVPLRFVEIKIRELEGIVELVKNGEEMGMIFLDRQFVKTCLTLSLGLITMFVSLEVFTLVVFWRAGDYSWVAFKSLCTDTCVFMQGTVGTHYVTLHLLLLHMFQKIQVRLKETLENRLNGRTEERISSSPRSVSPEIFEREIRRICRFYKSIHMNFLEDNKFLGPALLIWWNLVLAVNIMCVYVVLNSIIIQEPLGIVSIIFILKVCGCMVGIIIYLAEVEVTAVVVSF